MLSRASLQNMYSFRRMPEWCVDSVSAFFIGLLNVSIGLLVCGGPDGLSSEYY